MATTAPNDPHSLFLCLMCLMGVGTLLPWNFFINASGYWMYKFRTVTNSSTLQPRTGLQLEEGKNVLQVEFTSYHAIAAMIPNTIFLLLNGLFGHRMRTTPRLLWSLTLVILLFTITLVLVLVNTDNNQSAFLFATLTIIVAINAFCAIYESALLGLAGAFPSRYMCAVLNGQGVSGVFTSAVTIGLLAFDGDPVSSAFYCFLLAIIFLLGSLVSTLVLTRSRFYKHYIKDPSLNPEQRPLLAGPAASPPISVVSVLTTIRVEAATVLMIFIVTLGLFPAITVLVEPVEEGEGAWRTTYFVPTCCFLIFNIGSFSGRFFSSRLPRVSSNLALLLATLRLLFLPLFLLCNLAPGERFFTPVLIHSDLAFCIFVLILAVSNGYLTR